MDGLVWRGITRRKVGIGSAARRSGGTEDEGHPNGGASLGSSVDFLNRVTDETVLSNHVKRFNSTIERILTVIPK